MAMASYDAIRLAGAGQEAWTLAALFTVLTVVSSIVVALYRRGSSHPQQQGHSTSLATSQQPDRRQTRASISLQTTSELLKAATSALRGAEDAQARCERSAAGSRRGKPAIDPATGLSEDSTSNTSLPSLGSVPRRVQEDFNRSDAWPSEVQPVNSVQLPTMLLVASDASHPECTGWQHNRAPGRWLGEQATPGKYTRPARWAYL